MRLMKSRLRALLLAMAVAAIVATATATPSAAQANAPPTDVSISFRHGYRGDQDGHSWFFALTNQGGQEPVSGQVRLSFTRHADGTAVALVLEETSVHRYPREQFGDLLGPEHGHFDGETGIWHFRNLRPGHGIELSVSTFAAGRNEYRDLVRGRGEIISTIPKESAMSMHNNVAEGWKIQGPVRNKKAQGNAKLEMQVSDRSPVSGATTDFTVKFQNQGDNRGTLHEDFPLFGVEVQVSHSLGLEFVSASPPTGSIGGTDPFSVATTFDSGTGIWNIGAVPRHPENPFIDLPLTFRYNGDVPLEDACLTAELENFVPPEDPNPAYQLDNKVRMCLGEAPLSLVREGDLQILTVYPCVGVTTDPCDAQDTVEILLDTDIHLDDARANGVGYYEFPRPDIFLFQVEDT